MSAVPEIIFVDSNGSLNFGNYLSAEKLKSDDFEVNGDVYKVKTHNEITRAEKNGKLLYESIPGTNVCSFKLCERECKFTIEGSENAQVTLELEPETEYEIYIDNESAGKTRSTITSKLSFSVDLINNKRDIIIERI